MAGESGREGGIRCFFTEKDEIKAVSTVIYRMGVYRMTTKTITVINAVGLHARPATCFIQKANDFKCSFI